VNVIECPPVFLDSHPCECDLAISLHDPEDLRRCRPSHHVTLGSRRILRGQRRQATKKGALGPQSIDPTKTISDAFAAVASSFRVAAGTKAAQRIQGSTAASSAMAKASRNYVATARSTPNLASPPTKTFTQLGREPGAVSVHQDAGPDGEERQAASAAVSRRRAGGGRDLGMLPWARRDTPPNTASAGRPKPARLEHSYTSPVRRTIRRSAAWPRAQRGPRQLQRPSSAAPVPRHSDSALPGRSAATPTLRATCGTRSVPSLARMSVLTYTNSGVPEGTSPWSGFAVRSRLRRFHQRPELKPDFFCENSRRVNSSACPIPGQCQASGNTVTNYGFRTRTGPGGSSIGSMPTPLSSQRSLRRSSSRLRHR
jgi:hypothetical protein